MVTAKSAENQRIIGILSMKNKMLCKQKKSTFGS